MWSVHIHDGVTVSVLKVSRFVEVPRYDLRAKCYGPNDRLPSIEEMEEERRNSLTAILRYRIDWQTGTATLEAR